MSTAYFRGLNVRMAVRLQLLITFPVNSTGYYDTPVACSLHLPYIIRCIRRIAYQSQFEIGPDPFKGVSNHERIVLGLHSAYIENVLPGLQTECANHVRSLHPSNLCSVRNES